ncbi:MAG TPA: hypothetical protein VL992_12380 [Tepidisphaeraceae bacterium]|nr:hypothetical protein [Tepidisphaeraceae bacterium]
MLSLLWKEWHEQRWKLGFYCLVLCAMAWIGLRARVIDDESMSLWVCFIGLAFPIPCATGLLPAERADGSFESLLAMPIAPWRILAAETLAGLLLCVLPLAAAAAVSILVAGGREMDDAAFIAIYGRSALASVSLFVWMLALTSRLPNETRAGLLSIGVIVFWILATAGLQSLPPQSMAISPLGFVWGIANSGATSLATMLIVEIPLAAALWLWTSRRLAAEGVV